MNVNGIRSLDPNEIKFGEKMLQEIAAQLAELVIEGKRFELAMARIEEKLGLIEASTHLIPTGFRTVPDVRGPKSKYRGAPHSKKRKRS